MPVVIVTVVDVVATNMHTISTLSETNLARSVMTPARNGRWHGTGLAKSCGMQDNCAKQGLQPLPAFIEKIIQLYEMIVVRHGLMLVGQSFGMKTAAHNVLAAALSDLHEKVSASATLQSAAQTQHKNGAGVAEPICNSD